MSGGFFDALERDLVRAARGRSRRRRFAALALTSALALGVAGTAAAGTYLALRSSSIAPFAASDVTPEQRVAAGSGHVPELRAADPDPGAPPWTVRVSRSDTGLQCSAVGQVRGNEFGLVGLDGEFRVLPEANADACGEPGTLLGLRVFDADRPEDVRTVVNGVAGPELERVTVAVAAGEARTVPHSPEGVFALVLRGYPEDSEPTVELHLRGGETRSQSFAGDPNTVLDPDGGRAWSIYGSGGRVPRRATRRVGCLSFKTARPVQGQRMSSAPLVCGYEWTGRGRRFASRYFHTRRLSGDGPSTDPLRGDWNRHAPRVAAYGRVDRARRIVVRAPRFERVIDVRGGVFLVFLPASTDPDRVRIEIDGREYGPSFGTRRWVP